MSDAFRASWTRWAEERADELASKPWLLSKYEVSEGAAWSPEKVEVLISSLAKRLEIRSGETLAEVCCGSGWIGAAVAGDDARLVGVDFAPGMVRAAQRLYPKALFVVGDATRSPLRSASVDAVLCYFAIMNLADKEVQRALVDEVARVLRPGGRAIVGHCPLGSRSEDYDAAKERYLAASGTSWQGNELRDAFQPPIVTFEPDELLDLGRGFTEAEVVPSFNHFWLPGEPTTCEWRVDLLLRR